MKVYITKWWQSRGIVEAELDGSEIAIDAKCATVIMNGHRITVGKPHWDLSRAACVKRVRKLRDAKVAALHRQITRLSRMAIE